jgi:hypothetical protein
MGHLAGAEVYSIIPGPAAAGGSGVAVARADVLLAKNLTFFF